MNRQQGFLPSRVAKPEKVHYMQSVRKPPGAIYSVIAYIIIDREAREIIYIAGQITPEITHVKVIAGQIAPAITVKLQHNYSEICPSKLS